MLPPQLPTISVVIPCRIVLCAVGLGSRVPSLWLWVSIKPGQTILPAASMTHAASAPSSRPTSTMRSPSMATWAG